MEKFTTLTGVAAPLPMINVDTDMAVLLGIVSFPKDGRLIRALV